ncbi:MAG: Hsp20/alpha crystallin family protein [Anaerolineales bacterium]|jgi:HSP20 family protein
MAITDLVPWKRNETSVPVRHRQEEDAFLDLRSQMNRLFDDFFERPFGLNSFLGESDLMSDFAPRLDISETEKEISISAELPGMEPEDIHISLDHNTLTISGEKRAEKEEKDKRFHRVERSYGSFHRSIPLSDDVNEDKIDATFKRGVLKVKLPKTQVAQKQSKRIAIKSG